MKVHVASFIVQNQLVKSLVIENCRETDDEMDKIMNFFYEESYKTLTRVVFKNSSFEKLPFSLHFFFPMLKILDASNCNIKQISAFDLRGLTDLTALILDGNKLRTLPSRLFVHTPNLRSISFSKNEITKIDPDILEPLSKLKFANFSGNKGIDVIYARDMEISKTLATSVSLETLKKSIVKCNENKKILTISVNGRGFNMDRSKMRVHSPAIAAILEDNNEVDLIDLSEITIEAFRVVNAVVHDKPLPWDKADPRDVFAAAIKLQMNQLKALAEEKILLLVNSSTAAEFLLYGNNNNLESVKTAAFQLIKKMFPENILPSRLKNEPEKILTLLAAKKELEDDFAAARQKFSNVYNQTLE